MLSMDGTGWTDAGWQPSPDTQILGNGGPGYLPAPFPRIAPVPLDIWAGPVGPHLDHTNAPYLAMIPQFHFMPVNQPTLNVNVSEQPEPTSDVPQVDDTQPSDASSSPGYVSASDEPPSPGGHGEVRFIAIVQGGRRIWPCPFAGCGKTLPKLSVLKNHVLTHTGEKPHVCEAPHCGRAFAILCNLVRHQRNLHGAPRPEPRVHRRRHTRRTHGHPIPPQSFN